MPPHDVERLENHYEDTLLLGACCTALGTLVPVTLYQTGVLSQLPDPPMSVFDSERITASKAAHPFGVPDGLLGLVSFGATFTLAILARRHRTARSLLGAKLAFDAAVAAFNAGRQVISFGKLCFWCTGTAISAGVMVYAGRDTIRYTCLEAAAIGRKICAASGACEIVGLSPIEELEQFSFCYAPGRTEKCGFS